MIVDAHVHLFPPDVIAARQDYLPQDAWFRELYGHPGARLASADDLLRSMDVNGIDVAIVASFPWASQDLCERHNGYYRQLRHDRLRFLCTVQPRAGKRAVDELSRCLDAGFAGLGEMNPDAQGVELAEAGLLDPLAARLVEAKAAFMVHCSEPVGHLYPGKGNNTPDKVYHFAMRHPELKVVAAHWGGGLPFYHLMPEVGPALPNLSFDSAATDYLYDARVFGAVASLAGPERALFGSDYPLISQRRALRHARSSDLSEAARSAFFGANALAAYSRD